MKAQFILTVLSAASVLAAPIRRNEGKGVCKVHVGTQKQVTVVHTFYSTASAAPVSSAAPSTTSAFSSSSVSSISSSVPSVAAVVSAPSSSVAAAPAVTEIPAPSPSPSVQEEKEEVVIESPKVKEAPAPTSAAPVVVTPTPTPEPAAPAPTSAAPAVYVAPTTAAAAPVVTQAPKYEAAPIVENKAVAAAPAAAGSYQNAGEATYYDPDLGACGLSSSGSEMVAAISQLLFDPTTPNGNPNKNPICGRKARCSVKGGKEFIVTIVDRCVGCAYGDIDLSPAAFKASGAAESEGRVPVEWSLI